MPAQKSDQEIARNNRDWVYADAGMIEKFLPSDGTELSCDDLEKLAWAYWRDGQSVFARESYEKSLEQCPLSDDPGAIAAGLVYVLLEDEERALEYLQRSYERREREWVLETRWPWWDSLRDHPKFEKLMSESGLDKAAKPFSEFYQRRSSRK